MNTGNRIERIVEGVIYAAGITGHSTLVAGTAGVALSLTGAFVAAVSGGNIVDTAEKCAYLGIIGGGGIAAAWNAVQLAKLANDDLKVQGYALSSPALVTVAAEVSTLGAIGYVCAPAVQHMINVLSR